MNRIDEDSKICHLEVKAPLLSTGQNAGHKILENVGEILLRTVPRDAPFKVHFKGEADFWNSGVIFRLRAVSVAALVEVKTKSLAPRRSSLVSEAELHTMVR